MKRWEDTKKIIIGLNNMKQKAIKTITARQIEKAMEDIDAEGKNPLQKLADDFKKEQPALHQYLSETEDELNGEERDMLMTVALVGWYIVRWSLGGATAADVDFIDERLEANYELIEAKISERAHSDEPLQDILAYYNGQKELITFLVSLFVERPGGGSDGIRDEALMPMVVHLKTMIDCLALGGAGGAIDN
jgi:hypothetical protein